MADKKRILVCDDDSDFAKLLLLRLNKANFETNLALDALQVVQLARKLKPDCIVMDIQMPGGDLQQTLRKLAQSGQTLVIPIILMSGRNPDMSLLSEYQKMNFLPKPFEVSDLIHRIHQVTGSDESQGGSSSAVQPTQEKS